jgi:phosphate/sulfate permease
MMESGFIYTASIVVLFALYMAGNNGQYGVSNAVSLFPSM